ncbi:MBOAT family O-acyltransferase [Clostridium felsineum]|uniref:MBOAT family O-acyltransferase n=1 Tax=Clostridium felsineum TaxID=36839 RepID=UPI00098C8EB1|nr:MBOAT family protein [Clostridium felsineum]URZ16493.1 Peptidoglycan O-acetyltransferase [Clostridium felsineum DSM 794]
MLFSSIVFLFYFFPAVLLLYYICSFSRRLQNVVLLLASLVFYAWGDFGFLGTMVISIIVNYILGLLVGKFRERKFAPKFIVFVTCAYNLGMLFVFKYLGFVVKNINQVGGHKLTIPSIALPIGISYFTFKSISYVVDVYRNKVQAEKNPLNIGLYIAFFPEVISGPISRYVKVGEQIKNREHSWQKFSVGCCRFLTGLGKKVIISNSVAVIADKVFTMSSNGSVPVTLAWLGSIAYTLQIFFDFSGYSDMVIGLGLMFGFKIDENFDYPYISKSITEFWRRWHISLSSWFRDYIYIPLGGSRVDNKDKLIRNLFIVWVSTGVWHGAEWTFIMWGFLNFVFIALEKVFSFDDLKIHPVIKHIYALFVINLGWVLFRSTNLIQAGKYVSSMFGLAGNSFWSNYTFMFIKENAIIFIAGIILSMPIAKKVNKLVFEKAPGYKILNGIYPIAVLGLFFICISYLIKGTYNPFIYLKF